MHVNDLDSLFSCQHRDTHPGPAGPSRRIMCTGSCREGLGFSVVPARWMMGKLLHPEVWTSGMLVWRTKPWLCLRSWLALGWSKPCAWGDVAGKRRGDDGHGPRRRRGHVLVVGAARGAGRLFLGDLEASPSGQGEGGVRGTFFSSEILASAPVLRALRSF